MKKNIIFCVVVLAMLLPGIVSAQRLGEYTFTTGTDQTRWITVSDTTNLIELQGSNGDSRASALQSIGFFFRFGSEVYQSFSVNTDGNLRLGETVTGTGAYSPPFSSANAGTNSPKINAFGCDGMFANPGNYVRSELVGTAPNRIRVVEFCGSTYTSSSRSSLIRWQVQLFENGDVQMVFDQTQPTTAPATAHQCGMCVNASDGVIISQSGSSYAMTAFTSGTSTTLASGTWFDNNRYFHFAFPMLSGCLRPAMFTVDSVGIYAAALSWFERGVATAWTVEYGVHGFTPGTGTVVSVSAPEVVLGNLVENTQYDVYLRADCSGSMSDSGIISFHTLCDTVETDSLPYVYGFEDATGNGAAHDYSACWERHVMGSTTRYPYPSTTYVNTGSYALYIYSSSTIYSWTTLPLFKSPVNTLQLTLSAFKISASYGTFYVGVMSDPSDITTFDTIDQLYVSELNQWQEFEVPLSLYQGNGEYITILCPSGSSTNGVYIDDVTVDLMPECPRVMNLSVSNVTSNTADIAWNETGSASSWLLEYGPFGFVRGDGTSVDLSTTSYTFSNLDPGVDYDIYVSPLCVNGDTGTAVHAVLTTQCGLLQLPYSYGFETALTGSASTTTTINCWNRINDATSSSYSGYPYVASASNSAYEGQKYLYFQMAQSSATTGYAQNSYAVFPPIDIDATPMNTVELVFYAKASSATVDAPLYVGVMTHPDSAASFQVIDTIVPTSVYERYSVSFENYADTGRYVALLAKRAASTVYAYVDNVTLRQFSNCPEVTDVQLVSLTSDSATIAWPYNENIAYVDIYLGPAGFSANEVMSLSTNDTVYEFTSLTPDTEYEYYFVATCLDGSVGYASPRFGFRTLCYPIANDSLPYVEDFESYNAGAANPINPCWKKGTNNTTQYPYVSSSYAASGDNSLYFYAASTYYSYVALPMFEAGVPMLSVQFNARRYSSTTYPSSIVLGVMSNVYDFSTFEPYQVCTPTCGLGEWQQFYVSMEEYQGEGRFLAFALLQNVTDYSYIDDIVVDLLPDCRRPLHVSLDTVAAYDAQVSWVYNGIPASFEVAYSTDPDFDPDTCQNVATSNDTTVQLIGLTPFTGYYWAVRANCGQEYGDWSTISSFRTVVDCGADGANVVGIIGDSTASSSTYVMYTSSTTYMSGYSWHIFSSDELNELGLYTNNYLNGISLHSTQTGGSARMSVYLYETDMNGFSTSPVDTIAFDSMTCVYHGTMNFEPHSWNFIPFDTVFSYSGTRNLIVAFKRDTVQNGNLTFAYTNMGTNNYKTAYGYVNSSGTHSATRSVNRTDLAFNFCTTVPVCERPDSVTIVSLVDTAVTIDWSSVASQYEVSYGPAGFNPDSLSSQTTLMVYDDSLTIATLTPDTYYDFYVRSVCGPENSPWSFVLSFKTPCSPISLPFTENFDSYVGATAVASSGPISSCEYKGTNGTTEYPHVYASTSYPSNNLRFYSTTSVYSYFVLPLFADSVHNLAVTFDLLKTSDAYGHMYVGLMSDPNDFSTFTKVADAKVLDLNNWEPFEVTFDTCRHLGQNIAFVLPDSITSYAYLDNVVVSNLPSCRRPSNVVARNVASGNATISWSAPVVGPSYEIEYGYAGYTQGYGTTVYSTTDSVVLTGLISSRYYDVYIRAICSATDTSEWSFCHTFFSGCGLLSSFPYFNNFEHEAPGGSNASTYPTLMPCWSRFNNASSSTYQGYPYVYNSTTASYSGSRHLYFYTSTSSIYADNQIAILPQVDTTVVNMSDLQISFYAKRSTSYVNKLYVGVMSNPTDLASFNLVDSVDLQGTYQFFEILFDQYAGFGSYVALRLDKGTTTAYAYVDDLTLELIPTCRRPDGLVASNVTATSVQLDWVENNSASQWVVEYGPEGFVPGHGTSVLVNTNPAVVTGLAPATIYDVYVKSVCAAGDTSDYCRIPATFSTSQIPATVPYLFDFENATEWSNWQTSSNNDVNWFRGTDVSNDGQYSMYVSADSGATRSTRLNQIVNAVAYRDIDFDTVAGSFELSFRTLVGGSTDGNYDGVSVVLADPATIVESSSTALTTPWGHVNNVAISTVRHDSLWNVHTAYFDNVSGVKRVAFYWFNQSTQANHPFEGGPAAVDSVTIEYQTCARPYDLNVVNVGQTSVDLSWGGDANANYLVTYRRANGSTFYEAPAATNSVTLTGLNSSTSYLFWVRKVCGADTSAYSVNSQFTTLCDLYNALDTLYEDFRLVEGSTYNTAGVLPHCWEGYSNGTDAKYMPHVVSSGTYWYTASDSNAIVMTSGSTATYGNTKIVRLPQFRERVSSLTMSFWMATESATAGTLSVGYMTGDDYETDFVSIRDIPASSQTNHSGTGCQPNAGIYDTVSFESVPDSAMYVAFKWYYNSTFYSVCIDNIEVTAFEVCPTPVITSVTGDYASATVAWSGSGSNYEVAYKPADVAVWSNPVAVTDSTYTFAGLIPATTYDLRVRMDCNADSNGYSSWSQIQFTTDSLPCFAPTDLEVEATDYTSVTIDWTPVSSETSWVVNIFRGDVNIMDTVNAHPATIANLYSDMTYSVAVQAMCGNGVLYSDWSDTIQFTTDVCAPVTDVTATDITNTSAVIAWTSPEGSNGWQINYGEMDFVAGQGTLIDVNDNPYTLEGLDRNFYYDVYVRNKCADNVYSVWSTPVTSFQTTNVGIDEAQAAQFQIYPNPTTGAVTISISGQNGMIEVSVVDINGRTVRTESLQCDTDCVKKMNVEDLTQGAYFVRIVGENVNMVKKLIVR